MKTLEHWQRRLATAIQEVEDADRVWRSAMEGHAMTREDRVHVLWQERENAHARAEQLRAHLAAAQRRQGRMKRRVRTLRQMVAFVVWHTGVRCDRLPH